MHSKRSMIIGWCILALVSAGILHAGNSGITLNEQLLPQTVQKLIQRLDAIMSTSSTINGETIADDTIDDDSIDFSDVTGADLTLTDVTELTTSGTLTANGAVHLGVVAFPDATAYTNFAANSGKVHIMPNLTGDCTILVTNAVAGMSYEFVYAGGAADAQDWIITTGADANYFVGGVTQIDVEGVGTNKVTQYYSDGDSNSQLTIYTPEAGTVVRIWCQNGTNWYVSGTVYSDTDTGAAFADQ